MYSCENTLNMKINLILTLVNNEEIIVFFFLNTIIIQIILLTIDIVKINKK